MCSRGMSASKASAWSVDGPGPPRQTQLVRQDVIAAIEDTIGKPRGNSETDSHVSISSPHP